MANVYTASLFCGHVPSGEQIVLGPPGYRMVARDITIYTNDHETIIDFADLVTNTLLFRVVTPSAITQPDLKPYQWNGWWCPNEEESPFLGFKAHEHPFGPGSNGFDLTVTGHLLKLP